MFKAFIFKEWLKIRWACLAMLAVFVLMLINIVLNVAYNMRFSEPTSYWYNLMFNGRLFYSGVFIYVPALAGIVLALTQFIPEVSASRLKLTLHLPMKENSILLNMAAIGTTALALIYIFTYIFLSSITLIYFPVEMLWSVWLTSIPWFITGFTLYWATGMILIESSWIKRLFLIIISLCFAATLFYLRGYNLYEPSIHLFFLISLFFSISILVSAHRFRKGVV